MSVGHGLKKENKMIKNTDNKKKCDHNYVRVNTFVNTLGYTVATYKCKVCNGEVDAKALPRKSRDESNKG